MCPGTDSPGTLMSFESPGSTKLGLEEAHRISESPQRNSTKLLRNSAAPWISRKCLGIRREKC